MVTIATRDLAVTLGGRQVLRGISLTLRPGGMIGIIGPNGAGKSTLVRALLGLVPASGGAVEIDDRPLSSLTPAERGRAIAYLPQGQTLHWPLSVARLVALGRLPHLGPLSRLGAQDEAAITRALARADATHLADRDALSLSGGERARAMLARALAVEAPALVADEPLAALDPGHQIDVMTLLAQQARAGALVIVVLHDLTMAARHCDRLLLMEGGRLVADGTAEDVLTPQRLREVYGIEGRLIGADGERTVIPVRRSPPAS